MFSLFFHLPSDNEEEGIWRNYYTGKEINSYNYNTAKLSEGYKGNCALFVPVWKEWSDWQCVVDRQSNAMTCACENQQEMYLQLRGLCPDSNIDTFYVPKNKKNSGVVLLLGLQTSMIEYDKATLSWVLTDHSQNTTAVSNAPLDSYALGSHSWLINNDYQACSSKGEAYWRTLKLTGCREGEFTCSDGQCIRRCTCSFIIYLKFILNLF